MRKFLIVFIPLILLISLLVNSMPNKVTVDEVEQKKELKILVNDKMIKSVIDNISKLPIKVDIIFNNIEQEKEYSLSENIKSTISIYDGYIYNCKNSEPYAKDLIDLALSNKVSVIATTRGGQDLKSLEDRACYFLDGENLKIYILNIKNALQDLDPKNRDHYDENYDEYINLISFYLDNGFHVGKEIKDYIFVYPDEKYKEFTDYYSLSGVMAKDFNDSTKKPVFIYTKDSELQEYSMFIDTYDMKKMKLSLPSEDGIISSIEKNLKYLHLFKGDIIY